MCRLSPRRVSLKCASPVAMARFTAVLLALFAVACCGRLITVTTTDWLQVLKGTSSFGPLLPGDTVTFPGTAASPVTYSTTSKPDVTWVGTSGNPIVITGAEVGGAIINMATTGQNLLEIVRGSFFELKKLSFRGGSLGLRLGTGPAVTDVVTNALFEDVEVSDTRGTLITANQGSAGGIKFHDNVTFRRMHLHHPRDPAGTNE